jgi:ubiquinone/menaquinone biosynthesis C-methylase UbiE
LETLYRIGDTVRRRRLVRSELVAGPGERILDVGCGPGFLCVELIEDVGPTGSIVGVDSSPAMLALAARRCARHANVELKKADAASLPVKSGSFDAAVCVQVLEYLDKFTAGLRELHRSLRAAGRALIWDTD